MFAKQHHKAIAEIIKTTAFWLSHGPERIDRYRVILPESLANNLADYFTQDNPRFDRTRFLTACRLEGNKQ